MKKIVSRVVETLEKINSPSLPTTILIASVILGGFFYASQVNKQRSIERQQQTKIAQEKQDKLAKELKEQEAKEEAEKQANLNAFLLDTCLDNAFKNYSANFKEACKYRGLKEDCALPSTVAESLKDSMKNLENICFKRYPQE